MSQRAFLKRFPEFVDTDPKLIEMAINEAHLEMDKKYWGEMFDLSSMYLAAHKLAISPMGESVRLEGIKNKNIYQLEYERLCRTAFLGARVA